MASTMTIAARTTLTFRKATLADAAQVTVLVRSAYRGDSSRAGWTTEADLLSDNRIEEPEVVEKINNPNASVILAHDQDGVLAACCEVVRRDDGTVGQFGMFAVDPQRQAGGIGRQVLAEAEADAKRTFGLKTIEMLVIDVREELIAWYLRRGYEKTGRTKAFHYHALSEGQASRDDLQFIVLAKAI